MRRLFEKKTTDADIRPSLFSMASLMIILLPTLLISLSTQKFTALPLAIAGTQNDIPPRPNQIIQEITLQAQKKGFLIDAKVRSTDVRSTLDNLEEKQWKISSLQELQPILQTLKKLDPLHRRILIKPLPLSQTEEVVQWMDLVSKDSNGELFPEISIQGQE